MRANRTEIRTSSSMRKPTPCVSQQSTRMMHSFKFREIQEDWSATMLCKKKRENKQRLRTLQSDQHWKKFYPWNLNKYKIYSGKLYFIPFFLRCELYQLVCMPRQGGYYHLFSHRSHDRRWLCCISSPTDWCWEVSPPNWVKSKPSICVLCIEHKIITLA